MARPTGTADSAALLHPAQGVLGLRRIVTSSRFIPEVDGFRFIAILVVVVSHVYVQCWPLPVQGWFAALVAGAVVDGRRGVYLFFTISGFILALPFARHYLQDGKKVNLPSYFRRRITRLEPPYILAILLRAALLETLKRTAPAVLLVHLLATLFYVHNLVFHEYSTINPPAWSLEIEIQFYVLAPLLTSVFAIRRKELRRLVLLVAILGSGVAATVFIPEKNLLSLTLLKYFQYFAAGFLLCDLYLCGDVVKLPKWLWDAGGVGALIWILYSTAPWYAIALPFATLVLYLAGFYGGVVRAFFAWSPISLVGGMCYSIYLTHTTVLTPLRPLVQGILALHLWPLVSLPLIFAICIGASVLAGGIYYVFIERPCMDPAWPQRLAARWRGQS